MKMKTDLQNRKEEEMKKLLPLRRLGVGSWGFPSQSLQILRLWKLYKKLGKGLGVKEEGGRREVGEE